jgi:hypothetical protein
VLRLAVAFELLLVSGLRLHLYAGARMKMGLESMLDQGRVKLGLVTWVATTPAHSDLQILLWAESVLGLGMWRQGSEFVGPTPRCLMPLSGPFNKPLAAECST